MQYEVDDGYEPYDVPPGQRWRWDTQVVASAGRLRTHYAAWQIGWRPELHPFFPKPFRRALEAFLLCAKRIQRYDADDFRIRTDPRANPSKEASARRLEQLRQATALVADLKKVPPPPSLSLCSLLLSRGLTSRGLTSRGLTYALPTPYPPPAYPGGPADGAVLHGTARDQVPTHPLILLLEFFLPTYLPTYLPFQPRLRVRPCARGRAEAAAARAGGAAGGPRAAAQGTCLPTNLPTYQPTNLPTYLPGHPILLLEFSLTCRALLFKPTRPSTHPYIHAHTHTRTHAYAHTHAHTHAPGRPFTHHPTDLPPTRRAAAPSPAVAPPCGWARPWRSPACTRTACR
jgi:hypothetical protein